MPPSPLSFSDVVVANMLMMVPVYLLIGRGVWYLAQMASKVNQMWSWWDATQVRRTANGSRSYVLPDHYHD